MYSIHLLSSPKKTRASPTAMFEFRGNGISISCEASGEGLRKVMGIRFETVGYPMGLFGLGRPVVIQWFITSFPYVSHENETLQETRLCQKTRQCVPLQHSQQTRSHFGHGRNVLTCGYEVDPIGLETYRSLYVTVMGLYFGSS